MKLVRSFILFAIILAALYTVTQCNQDVQVNEEESLNKSSGKKPSTKKPIKPKKQLKEGKYSLPKNRQ